MSKSSVGSLATSMRETVSKVFDLSEKKRFMVFQNFWFSTVSHV